MCNACKTKETKLSLALGDVVAYVQQRPRPYMAFVGHRVVTHVSLSYSSKPLSTHYGVNGKAWYDRNELQLVREATQATLNKVYKQLLNEDDEDGSGSEHELT